MIWDSTEQELRVRLAHRVGAKFSQYKRLCEWLDCYQYILPSDRGKLHNTLRQILVACETVSDIYRMWLVMSTLETTFTWEDQEKLCQLIAELGTFPTLVD